MGDKLPLSELSLGEADSFLENLICQTQGSGDSGLDTAREKDVSDKDRALQIADDAISAHEKYKKGYTAVTEIMEKFDVGSTVAELGSTVTEIDPEAVMTATCVVLSAASNVASLKFPDLTMHKVLASLQRIEEGLDQLLTTPLNKAIDYYKTVLNAVLSDNFKLAFEKLPLLMDNATTAFHYANKKNIGIESYRECCKAIRLLIFATILQASYDEENRVFLPPNKLPSKSLDFIRRELEDIISRSSDQKNNVKLKSFGLFTIAKKSEVQDLLDSILKIAYPYISQARKLTDMNSKMENSPAGASLKVCLLPEALPEGYDDKIPVIIGFKKDEDGIKSVVKIHVWRIGKFVWYEHKDAMFYKLISSESDPVDMEDAESGHPWHPGPFTVSIITGQPVKLSGWLGVYTITEKEHRGRPVYSGGDSPTAMLPTAYLYSSEDGGWAIAYNVGNSKPHMRSPTAAPSPDLCTKWEYSDAWNGVGPPYKDWDITVTIKK